MKHSVFSPDRAAGRRRGVALVLVLTSLVLLSALIIAFFSSVSTELSSATSYAAGVSTKQLSETATNVVIGQITDATQGYIDPTSPSNTTLLGWASQPGMIRSYNQSGIAYRYYKLYSANNMVVAESNGFDANAEFDNDVPSDWASQAGLYTDLNAPVLVPDPNGSVTKNGFSYTASYPIVDPSAQAKEGMTTGTIEGFSIGNDGNQLHADLLRQANANDPTSVPSANPAPMPVRWLYVLKDGTITCPSGFSDGKVRFDAAPVKPSVANPIVGRIAFWADDDTCKVNINTASEGTFWDQPRSGSSNASEAALAAYQPAQNEFQRYPGHPAMTCLSPLLENFGPHWTLPGNLKNYYSLVPRVEWGGSLGGTVISSGPTGVIADNDRLFASIDELAYDVHYKPTVSPIPTRARDSFLARSDLERLKFFVTANSRAPEVNLFNRPRVCLWPVQSNTATISDPVHAPLRNAKDQLISFCTSTGKGDSTSGTYHPYYFQRYNVYYNGLTNTGSGDTHTPSTFVSPVPSSQSPWMDMTNVSRNQQLYQYLQFLTGGPSGGGNRSSNGMNIPGFGGNLKLKYDGELPNGYSDRDQILTEMYDLIRTGVNTYNSALTPTYDYAPTRSAGTGSAPAGQAQTVPTLMVKGNGFQGANPNPGKYIQQLEMQGLPGNTALGYRSVTHGFGRFSTIPEIGIVFYYSGTFKDSGSVTRQGVSAAIVMEQYNPTPGLGSWSPHARYAIRGLGQFKLNGQSLWLPDVGTGQPVNPVTGPWNYFTARIGYVNGGHTASIMGLESQFHYFAGTTVDPAKKIGMDGTEKTYPFVTQPPTSLHPPAIDLTQTTMQFTGGPIQIQIFAGYENVPDSTTTPTQLVQVLNVNFPSVTIPVPKTTSPDMDFNTRMANGNFIEVGDVVRSMIVPPDNVSSVPNSASTANAAMGDYRMLAGMFYVPDNMYTPHPYYKDPTQQFAHSLRSSDYNNPYYLPNAQPQAATFNPTLVPGQAWVPFPSVPRGQVRAANVAGVGDFDSGMGGMEDGPYTNKADEGNLAAGGGNGYFGRGRWALETGASLSPNRQISSAVMFGSLPTGVKATEAALFNAGGPGGRPWQTLLFCPNPAAGGTSAHPGFGVSTAGQGSHYPPYTTPPDHLFLDLFTMPIVEPYAISEPFSTAGKINLNYQIAPFTYIKRTSGIRAVMRSTKVAADKTGDIDRSSLKRYDIEMEESKQGTLLGFDDVFKRGDIFRSASQICDIYLVPKGAGSYNSMTSWWAGYLHTGDNVREYPYGHIYPRVTTKSNTFTVHVRVQTLQKANSRDATTAAYWDESRDRILGEYRGSNTIERYIDLPCTGDPKQDLPDFALPTTTTPIDVYYKFRTLSSRRFSP